MKVMNDEQFRNLLERLDTLIKLVAMNALKGKNLTEQVEILLEIDLQPREIATILRTDPNTVRALKSRVKKRRTKKDLRKKRKYRVYKKGGKGRTKTGK